MEEWLNPIPEVEDVCLVSGVDGWAWNCVSCMSDTCFWHVEVGLTHVKWWQRLVMMKGSSRL